MERLYYTETYATSLRRILPDLLRSRELLLDLVWKDIRIRYRYAVLGFLWAVLEPLLLMLVLTFVFSIVFKMDLGSRALGYGAGFDAVFILTGVLAWQFLSAAVTSATQSLVQGENLVTKVNFPREILPLAAVGVALINALIGVALLLVLRLALMGFAPVSMAWLLATGLVQLALVAGVSLVLSTLNITFRDVAYITNAALVFGFYATPILYQPALVRNALDERGIAWLYPCYFLNPMAGVVAAYREALLFGRAPGVLLAWPAMFSAGALVLGLIFFRRRSGTLADQR
jgi:ABC-type polysaccharide/polyol phosphate export permease